MHRYTSKTLEEGKLTIHVELRRKLKLKPKKEVVIQPLGDMLLLQEAGVVTLLPQYAITTELDGFGRIALSKELRDKLGWSDTERIAVYYTDERVLVYRPVYMAFPKTSRHAP